MTTITPALKLLLDLTKIQSVLNRRFDNGLGGLGFNEFIILYQLSQSKDRMLRRIDLAERIGLTASGVTRLLLPMEKVGLVQSGAQGSDARVRIVQLATGGERRLEEAMERAELLSQEIVDSANIKDIDSLSEDMVQLAKSIYYPA